MFLIFLFSPGKNSQFVEGVVPPRSLPQPVQETPLGPGNGTHTHTGRQLVQEPPPKRPCCFCKEQVSQKCHAFMLIMNTNDKEGRKSGQYGELAGHANSKLNARCTNIS